MLSALQASGAASYSSSVGTPEEWLDLATLNYSATEFPPGASSGAAGKWGVIFDGMMNAYQDYWGNSWVSVPNMTNYRILLKDWNPGSSSRFVVETPTFDSRYTYRGTYHQKGGCGEGNGVQGTATQFQAKCTNWLLGFLSVPSAKSIFSVAHQEWYETPYPLAGNNSALAGFNQINSVTLLKSYDSGATFVPEADRRIAHYRAWDESKDRNMRMLGLSHPSAFAYENGYMYVFADYRANPQMIQYQVLPDGTIETEQTMSTGVVLFRKSCPAIDSTFCSSGLWQVWKNDGTWGAFPATGISDVSAKIFFYRPTWNVGNLGAGAGSRPPSALLANSVRYHTPSRSWILFGNAGSVYKGESGIWMHFSRTLANPSFHEESAKLLSTMPEAYPYLSVIDENSADPSFQTIDSNFHIYWADDTKSKMRRSAVTLTCQSNCNETDPLPTLMPSVTSSPEIVREEIGYFVVGPNDGSGVDAAHVYYTNGGQYCWKDDYVGTTSGLSTLQAVPTGQTYVGRCRKNRTSGFSTGHFKVKSAVFYSNGTDFCRVPNPSCYSGQNSDDFFHYPKLMPQDRYVGWCSCD